MRGRNKPWANDFINDNAHLIYNKEEVETKPLTLEVGIGKGDFIIANAKENQDYIHIGVELNTSIFAIAMTFAIKAAIKKAKNGDDSLESSSTPSTTPTVEKPKTQYCAYCGVALESGSNKCKVCGARNDK